MELLVVGAVIAMWVPYFAVVATLVGMVAGVHWLWRWFHRYRPGRPRIVKRLDECPECGSGWSRQEPSGKHWQIWCDECRTVSLAYIALDAPRPVPGEAPGHRP